MRPDLETFEQGVSSVEADHLHGAGSSLALQRSQGAAGSGLVAGEDAIELFVAGEHVFGRGERGLYRVLP